jgi:benzoyl-CoA reductase/2-hydroxyglutaryl-CoA dehydratase subunit BcrC/BadD/HgdB
MTNEKELFAKIYFFRKFNESPIPGFDQISIVAFSKDQAYNSLSKMGKQKQILKKIISDYQEYLITLNEMKQDFLIKQIKIWFKKSLNKNDLIRKILNEVVLSNDEIVTLLRIIFNKR